MTRSPAVAPDRMETNLRPVSAEGPHRYRCWWLPPLAAALLMVGASVAGCSGDRATGGPSGEHSSSPAPGASPTPVTQGGTGTGLPGTPSHHQSGVYSGRFSAAFADCMRTHGVPAFPHPDGTSDQLLHSGIDTHSVAFQDALYGACKSLAPAAWVSAPPLGTPPGSQP